MEEVAFLSEKVAALRPELTEVQWELFGALLRAKREAAEGRPAPRVDILRELETVHYESDIALKILQRVDDHHAKRMRDKTMPKEEASDD